MDSCHFHPSLLVSVQSLTSAVKDIMDLETLSFTIRMWEIIRILSNSYGYYIFVHSLVNDMKTVIIFS